jgi:hypothetical protein
MKNKYKMRRSLLFFLLALSNTLWAVSFPPQSYAVYNDLYEINHDNVKMDQGTLIKGINHVLQASNDEWGTECVGEYGPKNMNCRACCGQKLEAIELDKRKDYDELHAACLTMCNTGLPLGGAPLDVPMWFVLPLCGLYGVVQRIRCKKTEK